MHELTTVLFHPTLLLYLFHNETFEGFKQQPSGLREIAVADLFALGEKSLYV